MKVGVYNEDGEPLGFEYVYEDDPNDAVDDDARDWMSGPHGCGATHNPDKIDCDDALELHAIDDRMLRNAF